MSRKHLYIILFFITSVLCYGTKKNNSIIKSRINSAVKTKLTPVVPPPGNPNIEIRGYSIDTINNKIYVAGKFLSYDGN